MQSPALEALKPLVTPRDLLPSHPDYAVSQEGLFTIVRRTKARRLNDAVYAYSWRWLKAYATWLPLLARFWNLVGGTQARRLLLFVLGRISVSLLDVLAVWSETRFDSMVSEIPSVRRRY